MKFAFPDLCRCTRGLLKHGVTLFCFCTVSVAAAEAALYEEGRVRDTNVHGDAVERHLPTDQIMTPWIHDPAIFERDEGDRTEIREVDVEEIETIKVHDLVPPIYFGLGEIEITEEYLQMLRGVLDDMRERAHVRLHFVGHADNLPLRGDLVEWYGDNVGLSRERAGTVAEYCQRALNLPPEAISYEGLGDSVPVGDNATEEGRRMNRRVEVQVWYDEVRPKQVKREVVVPQELRRIKVCRTETVCKLRYKEGHAHRARIKNMIAPLHFEKGMLSVPEDFLRQVRQAMVHLEGKPGLVIRFIAHTDTMPLTGRDARIYGDPVGFTKAVARRVALAVQDDLNLPSGAVETEGLGTSRPIASNDTQQGRVLNRRVEVEFWHDDPLQDLPDEPQLCPDSAGAETVTRVYEPESGGIAPVLFADGNPAIPEGYTDDIRRIMNEVRDRTRVRLRFVGYTGNTPLDRRTAAIYGDDVGLSMARARRAMHAVRERMGLAEEEVEFDGRGFVQSDDVVNAGFMESGPSRVRVQVVYDESILREDYSDMEVTPLTREVTTADPFALNHMRITVDGTPVDDPGKCSSDVQRCTDVALREAQIHFKYDSLKLEPRLNVTAWPTTIRYQDLAETPFVENMVHFRMYTNYRSLVERAEIRVFDEAQSVQDTPVAVLDMDMDGATQWQPNFDSFSAPLRKLKYLVRVYNAEGLFDETIPQPLWVANQIETDVMTQDPHEQLLAGYGESRISRREIPLRGGTVYAQGTAIPEGYSVWMAGYAVPVDKAGRFVAEEILPEGTHSVEVAVLDRFGNGELFLRDLTLKESDWFTVGIADLTLSGNKTNGPAKLLAEEKARYSEDLSLQGRLAFYTNGKLRNGWSVTASADTEEGPLDEIFTNFMDKSPDALFRRMDSAYHYPTHGDDSTVTEDAPTSGKFYIRMKKDETYGLWGNFHVGYTDTDLAHVDRGLYGAHLHYQPSGRTSFGEPIILFDGFAADPGTVAGRDEFRGTGGSLYFLRRQDILEGSERVRVEVRDRDSGMVLAVKNLMPILDYDLDYLQGRMLLTNPLSPTADHDLLVSTESISGHPVYLVIRYEYTPGFEDPDTLALGGRVHYWLNDHVKVGFTASHDEEAEIDNTLGGVDLTLRKSAASWIKMEVGYSDGPGVATRASLDGGFNFQGSDLFQTNHVEASAYRVDGSLGFQDVFTNGRGHVTFYLQDVDAGYSAPGLVTASDLLQYGGTVDFPFTDHMTARLKADRRDQRHGLTTDSGELNLDYRLSEHWTVGSGIRYDNRKDRSPVVPETRHEGQRLDGAVKLLYDSRERWTTYGFVQTTIQSDGDREDNGRIGAGGSLRVTERFKVDGELSGGDLGPGAKLGSEFLYSDWTTLYLNYSLENERTDNGLRARKGNMTSGFRTRYSESTSVYLEEQYIHGDVPSGLLHSTGVELTPTSRLNLGGHIDVGTLKDPQTDAELKRTAAAVTVGYGFQSLKVASALEYRVDDAEQPDTQTVRRTTWLTKNSFKYQISPEWRLLGKLNYAHSDSSQGQFFDGDYTEAVLGYGYRPVRNDRLNALMKYTYFYNVPTVSQSTVTRSGFGVIQRSQVGALDIMYDLTERWTIGGKYAYRYGQVSQDRVNREYFTSRAHLAVLRADWHALYRWDALVEARILDLPDARDRLSGMLIAVYRHMGDRLKLGVGYNFSKFSDDLTDLDYDHQGLFVNVVGKY